MIAATVNRNGFELALSAARDEGSVRSYAGLSAPLDGGLLGKISEVWEGVERALRDAFVYGAEKARDGFELAIASAERLIQQAGARARDVHQALLAKVQAYLSELVDAALRQVRTVIEVGDARLVLDGLEVSQAVSLTGSVKAALTEMVALTSAGELTVTARYGSSKVQDV